MKSGSAKRAALAEKVTAKARGESAKRCAKRCTVGEVSRRFDIVDRFFYIAPRELEKISGCELFAAR